MAPESSQNRRLADEGRRFSLRASREPRYAARRREENRAAWCRFHQDQAARHRATLEALATYHESKAAKLQLKDAVVEGEGVDSKCPVVPQ
jgi:hypothetical protein